jgi:histidine triad (HIT) family protein
MNSSDCIFCKIVSGELPAVRLAENEDACAFLDLVQVHPGHVLIIPKHHYADLYALPGPVAAAVMVLAQQVATALLAALQPAGLSLLQSNGAAAGQEVMHLHVHLLPRAAGDGLLRLYPSPPHASDAAELEALGERIRAGLAQ